MSRSRSTASVGIAALAATLAVAVAAPASAAPQPKPDILVLEPLVYGPQAGLSLVTYSTASNDFAAITASSTAFTDSVDPNGYSYDCGPGGTLSASTHTVGGSVCEWPPSGSGPLPFRPVTATVRDTGSPALRATQQSDWSVPSDHGPVIALSADAGTGALAQTVTLDFAGTTSINGTVTWTVDCGNGTAGTMITTTQSRCTYASALYPTITVTALDRGNRLSSSRQVMIAVNSKPLVNRIAGTTRDDTGVKVSQGMWAATTDTTPFSLHPKAVVLARDDNYADALAGVPLAAKKGGPLLLTPPTSLDPEVKQEIQRILPTAAPNNVVYVLGGVGAIAPGIVTELQGLGYVVERFAGATRFDTALAIAQSPDALNNPPHVIVATGLGFADALSAGPLAALPSVNAAIVLSDGGTFDANTQAYVEGKLGAGGVVAIGGPAKNAVSALPNSSGHFVSIAGSDRYQTAQMVADVSDFGSTYTITGVATGLNFADALTGGSMMALIHCPIMLTDPNSLSAATAAYLDGVKYQVHDVDIFGGTGAVSTAVALQIVTAVDGVRNFSS